MNVKNLDFSTLYIYKVKKEMSEPLNVGDRVTFFLKVGGLFTFFLYLVVSLIFSKI